MKPIVLKVDSEGRILMTADDIQKIVDEAYQTGFEDGKNSKAWSYQYPSIINTTEPYKVTLCDVNTATAR